MVAQYLEDTNIPLYILGSSLFGAQLAAMLGLPRFLRATGMLQAVKFTVSGSNRQIVAEPYVMVGCNAIVAETSW